MGQTLSQQTQRDRRAPIRTGGRAQTASHGPVSVGELAARETRANASPRVHQLASMRNALNLGQPSKVAPTQAPVLQAAWLEGIGPNDSDRWDSEIDGVTWFKDPVTDLLWFQVTKKDAIQEGKVGDYEDLEGPGNARTFREWNLISVRPVLPARLGFEVNERQAQWGSVFEVAPGIGVEIPKGEDASLVEFIAQTLGQIEQTKTGLRLLQQFDPTAFGSEFRQVGQDQYQGLTTLIGRPAPSRNLIETLESGGRKPGGQKVWSDPKIPRISFFGPDAEGTEIGASGARVTSKGIVGHKDFPDSIQPFDVVLYHELIHAFLSHMGVGARLRELGNQVTNKLPTVGNPDNVEEQLVVGILGGLGLPFSENAYRQAQGYEPRTSYKSVGIESDLQELEAWSKVEPATLLDALMRAGLSKEQARFVVTGVAE